jgi:hypothetical protein
MPRNKETLAAQRRERFADAQAALPEEERLENRSDLALPASRAYSIGTQRVHRDTEQFFQEFMELTQPTLYDPAYFKTRGPVIYTAEVFKAYCVYLAQTREGRISSKISVHTIISYLATLFGLIGLRRQSAVDRGLAAEVRAFASNDLKEQEGLSFAKWPKPVALHDDTTIVFSVLFSPSYLATFADMRLALNTALFINIMIDCAGRGGDIAFNSRSTCAATYPCPCLPPPNACAV